MLTDRSYLKDHQYKTPDNLSARIALHRQFGTNPYSWQKWVFDQLDIQPGMRVLDVGCGPADLWRENLVRCPSGLWVAACDLSVGMLEKARQSLVELSNFAYSNIDTQEIPFRDQYFDRSVANHNALATKEAFLISKSQGIAIAWK